MSSRKTVRNQKSVASIVSWSSGRIPGLASTSVDFFNFFTGEALVNGVHPTYPTYEDGHPLELNQRRHRSLSKRRSILVASLVFGS
jgi:hypothetical protein